MKVTGELARLKVGFQLATEVVNWNLVYKQEEVGEPYGIFTGTLQNTNDFWINQRPLILGLQMSKDSWWVWNRVIVIERAKYISIRVQGNPEARLGF